MQRNQDVMELNKTIPLSNIWQMFGSSLILFSDTVLTKRWLYKTGKRKGSRLNLDFIWSVVGGRVSQVDCSDVLDLVRPMLTAGLQNTLP